MLDWKERKNNARDRFRAGVALARVGVAAPFHSHQGWRAILYTGRPMYRLYRETDVPHPVRHDDLTLDEVEETLSTWKLRGPHGG